MKLEKEVKIIRVHSENSIVGDNYTEIKLDGALSHKDFKNIADNFTDKKIKLTLEIEEPILDEEERKYLSGVIRPFRDKIRLITKRTYDLDGKSREFIAIVCYGWTINFTAFKIGLMYKGMELNKEYTLEELGL